MGSFSFLAAGIGLLHIGKAGQVVHAGVQGFRQLTALLEGHVALAGFYFRILALVYACQHLYFDLRIFVFLTQLLQSAHNITQIKLWQIVLLTIRAYCPILFLARYVRRNNDGLSSPW